MRPFFYEYLANNLIFINPLFSKHFVLARKKGLNKDAEIYFWGRKSFTDVEEFALKNGMKIFRVEDGFIRSVGLGSDLTQPYSQVIDKSGIYFDPTQPSDLENYLNFYDFENDEHLLQRAKKLQEQIIKNKISKYNAQSAVKLHLPPQRRTAVVIGQVEDDASIKYGANGMTNMQLLQQVRENYPELYVVFKPHPDVLSGNRVGHIDEADALKYCDEVITDVSISDVLNAVDEVHTMTSLTGFEGLLYSKEVYTYGMPFYAGWGLTHDTQKCQRRKRELNLTQLIAATYLLYPRYISPKTKKICEAELVIAELKEQKDALAASFVLRSKSKVYSYFSRITQKLLSLVG